MRRLSFLVAAILVAACYQAPAGSLPSTSNPTETPSATITASLAPSVLPTPIPTPSELPSPSPTPSDMETEPTPYVSTCPGGTSVAGGFSIFTAVVIGVDSLNVRDGPCLAGHLIDEARVTNPAKKGTLLMTLTRPVTFDGYRWYAVGIDVDLGWAIPAAGWVAAGTTSDSWLRPATLSCPEPSLASIAALSDVKRLACFGSRSLTFTAHQAATPPDAGFGGACDAQDGQPAWLWCWNTNYNYVNADGGSAVDEDMLGHGMLKLFFDPATGIKPLGLAPAGTTGPAYQIRGHFDDAAASECTQGFGADSVAWYEAQIICRTEFVVETLQRVP